MVATKEDPTEPREPTRYPVSYTHLFFTGFLALLIVYFIFKGHHAIPCEIKKPEKFNSVQRKTLLILGIVLALVLLPAMVNTLHPLDAARQFAGLFDIQMLSIVGAVICALLHLGDEKKILLQSVPWNTIILEMCIRDRKGGWFL